MLIGCLVLEIGVVYRCLGCEAGSLGMKVLKVLKLGLLAESRSMHNL